MNLNTTIFVLSAICLAISVGIEGLNGQEPNRLSTTFATLGGFGLAGSLIASLP